MNAGMMQRLFAVFLAGGVFAVAPVLADSAGGGDFRRGDGRSAPAEGFRQASPEQAQFLRVRRDARRDGDVDAALPDRREAQRERWQQGASDERQKLIEQHRTARQLSPEERRQLRRDILEANRGSREDRGR